MDGKHKQLLVKMFSYSLQKKVNYKICPKMATLVLNHRRMGTLSFGGQGGQFARNVECFARLFSEFARISPKFARHPVSYAYVLNFQLKQGCKAIKLKLTNISTNKISGIYFEVILKII